MANIMDYLKWRGDLSFSQAPFCEVDNLILANLSYVNLDGIAFSDKRTITVADASARFFEIYTDEELENRRSFIRNAPFLLRAMADTRRFGSAKIRRYTNIVDEEQTVQFAAIEIMIGDRTSYVSFRGTDDNLVGWQEDFNISIGTVPAQTAAHEYLEHILSSSWHKVRVGGHSKGGHLALYSSAKCKKRLQKRILNVYNNDGPGLLPELMDEPGLARITPKLVRIIPHFSIFGMLLEHPDKPIIIESENRGIMQHDAFSWKLDGPMFLRSSQLHNTAVLFHNSMTLWLAQINNEQKKAFINDLFSVLEASGYKTIPQIEEHLIKAVPRMLRQLSSLNPETKDKVEALIKILINQWTSTKNQS